MHLSLGLRKAAFVVTFLTVVSVASADKMYWTDVGTNKIQRADLDGTNIEDLVTTGVSIPDGLALDLINGKMYWADYGNDTIKRANLDGSSVETLLSGRQGASGIALDLTAGKIYWTDFILDHIARANLDGSGMQILINSGITIPIDIALDVPGGKMYWIDQGTNKVQRANLDGSGVQDIVATAIGNPIGIALDLTAGKVYWTDDDVNTVERANLDGSGREDVVTLQIDQPHGVATISGSKVYWTDGGLNTIKRANLDGSNIETVVTGLQSPFGIALDLAPCVDATPPTAELDMPSPFSCGCDPVEIIGTADDGDGFGQYAVEYQPTSGGPWTLIATGSAPVVGGTLATWNTGALPQGYYFVRLTVENACGGAATDVTLVWLGKEFDTVDIRSPNENDILGRKVCFDGTVTDNICFDSYIVEYEPLGGGGFNVVDPANPVYFTPVRNDPFASWDTVGGGVPDGDYTLRVTARDRCGNRKIGFVERVTIDNTPPEAVIDTPENCETLDGLIPIKGTAFDVNIDSWSLQYTGGLANNWVTIATGNTSVISDTFAEWDSSRLLPCAYTIRLVVTDKSVLNCNSAIRHRTEFMVSITIGDGECAGDVNKDGFVDFADILIVLANWGICP